MWEADVGELRGAGELRGWTARPGQWLRTSGSPGWQTGPRAREAPGQLHPQHSGGRRGRSEAKESGPGRGERGWGAGKGVREDAGRRRGDKGQTGREPSGTHGRCLLTPPCEQRARGHKALGPAPRPQG